MSGGGQAQHCSTSATAGSQDKETTYQSHGSFVILAANPDGRALLLGESRACVFIISIPFGIGGDAKSNEVGTYSKGWVVWRAPFASEKP